MSLSALIAYASDSDDDTADPRQGALISSSSAAIELSAAVHSPLPPTNAEKLSRKSDDKETDHFEEKLNMLRKRLRPTNGSLNCASEARQLAAFVAERSGAKQTIAEVRQE